MSAWPAGRHLASIYDALYQALGEGAPRVTHDAFVVRLHEASRAFGALALELRDDDDVVVEPVVYRVLLSALADDDSGALALYALAMLIGPRLLVTLRDYLETETDPARREILSRGSDQVVREVRAVGAVVTDEEPLDDPAWAKSARAMYETLDAAGMAESLGPRH